jgi:UDP-glucose:(heptosyl)LPS alpha-1,3-glucosyltransferase
MPELVLLRRSITGAGGAERVFAKYEAAFDGPWRVMPLSGEGLRGPSWWKALRFTLHADAFLGRRPEAMSLSLERGPSAKIYRAGDGVHVRWRELSSKTGLSLNPLHLVMQKLEAKSLRCARIVIANSKMVSGDLIRFYPEIAPKIRVVYNGFDPARFFPSSLEKSVLRTQLGLPVDVPLFLFVGSGWLRKGIKQAQAITRLVEGARLVVVGKGSLRMLDGSVSIYKGVQSAPEKFYQACDALILPTLYDPFANVTLEALACGLPVVTSAHNGASEILTSETGFVLASPNSDWKSAAEFLKKAIGADPFRIAQTVGGLTLEHEIEGLKKIFAEVEALENV